MRSLTGDPRQLRGRRRANRWTMVGGRAYYVGRHGRLYRQGPDERLVRISEKVLVR